MFFCEECREKNGWPKSLFKSRGPCEVCHKSAVCNDVPSKHLSPVKPMVVRKAAPGAKPRCPDPICHHTRKVHTARAHNGEGGCAYCKCTLVLSD
jgi:hypothetical protein